MKTMVNREMLEFEVDTRLARGGDRKSGIPFHLQKQNVTLIVLWGDGTHSILKSEDYTSQNALASVHEYEKPGRYRISIYLESPFKWSDVYISTLDCQDIVFECLPSLFNEKTECLRLFKQTLVAIPAPLPRFRGTIQYTSVDLSNTYNGIRLNDNFSYLFIHCSSLESICPKLFVKNSNSISFSYCFYGCRSLKSIPEDIFKGCIDVLSYSYCFFGCYEIKEVPPKLFEHSHKVQGFKGVFKDCLKLKSIPEDLFYNGHSAEIFSEAFQNCVSLKSIPENLFSSCIMALGFSCTFENCLSLRKIPEKLFWNCSNAIYFRSTFAKSGIESIPARLFIGKRLATTFSYTFGWCGNIKEVPSDLFGDSYYAADFSGCFYGCRNLEKVASNIFSNCIYARRFSHCFYGCHQLKKASIRIPSRIVDTFSLFVQKAEDTNLEIVVPRMSYTAELISHRAEELGVKVVKKTFIFSTFFAWLQSALGIVRHG